MDRTSCHRGNSDASPETLAKVRALVASLPDRDDRDLGWGEGRGQVAIEAAHERGLATLEHVPVYGIGHHDAQHASARAAEKALAARIGAPDVAPTKKGGTGQRRPTRRNRLSNKAGARGGTRTSRLAWRRNPKIRWTPWDPAKSRAFTEDCPWGALNRPLYRATVPHHATLRPCP